MKQITAASAETTIACVSLAEAMAHRALRFLIEALFQDRFDGAVKGAVKGQCAVTCSLKPCGSEAFGQGDDPLGSTQIVQDALIKEPLDER
jgi:hypothetical protein